jgi:DNA polymerase-3 subunit gamma/tau
VFVLCTTDAQKIPLPVIGRCQQFVFRRHSEDQIVGRLSHIARSENIEVDAEAMRLIARTAQGSMRDAVGLLDQLVPLATGPISLEGARSLLGIADPRLLDSLLDDVLQGRAAEALDELNRVYSAGAELRQVVRGLMESCRDRLIAALTRRDRATAQRLSSVLDALLHLDGEVRRHAEPRFLVEATLARLAVELGMADTTVQEVSSPLAGKSPAVPGDGGVETGQAAERTAVVAEPATSAASGDVSGWADVLEKLNRTVRAVYRDAQPELSGSTLVLWFRYEFHHKKAQEQSAQLLPLVREWLGNKVAVDFRLREIGAEGAKAGPRTSASPEDDPFVREVVRRFDGRVTRVKEVTE